MGCPGGRCSLTRVTHGPDGPWGAGLSSAGDRLTHYE